MLLSNLDLLATAPGGVARLRELILTLAVQGKLVPQDPADEPASELLKQIRAEKERLIAEGKSKWDKPLARIKDDILPCSLPRGWSSARLTELGEFRGGKTPSTQQSTFWGGDIPWITPKDMKQLRLSDSEDKVTRLAVDDGLGLIPAYSVLVVVRSGILRRTVPTAVNEVATTINQDLKALVLVQPELSGYVQLMIRGFERFILQNLTKIGTTVESIQFDAFASQAFPIPPLAEQSRIVARVEELMRLCDALEAKGQLEAAQHAQLVSTLLATLTDSATPEALAENWQRLATHFDTLLDRPEAVDALEQTILQLAVRGLLVLQDPQDEPTAELLKKIRAEKDRLIAEGKIKRDKPLPPIAEDEQPFALPQGWEWGRLEQMSMAIVDCPHSTPKFVERGRLCLDTNSFKQGQLLPHKLRYVDESTFTERNSRLIPRPGDLVFAREGSVGESILIPDGVEACLGQRVMLFRFSERVSKEFVQLAISSTSFLEALLALHKGIGAKHVNVGDMRMAVVPLPPLPEQARIVARVDSLRRLCADLRQRLVDRQSTQARLSEALVAHQAG